MRARQASSGIIKRNVLSGLSSCREKFGQIRDSPKGQCHMLAGKRRLGRTLLERHIVYDLTEDSSPIGFIEYSADRDRIEIRGQRYSVLSERKPMTLLGQVAKLLTWRWKDVFAFRDAVGQLIATSEKSALNMFSLHHGGAVFSIRPRG